MHLCIINGYFQKQYLYRKQQLQSLACTSLKTFPDVGNANLLLWIDGCSYFVLRVFHSVPNFRCIDVCMVMAARQSVIQNTWYYN